ncbi:hypothetical protein WJX72_009703 [[Myrmecia] bisecta]|uniref:Secreted protein n=1 Tax=[Myrmecia] bisecta TaxID=41462 RepID=A0AAW1QG38_9CHLO
MGLELVVAAVAAVRGFFVTQACRLQVIAACQGAALLPRTHGEQHKRSQATGSGSGHAPHTWNNTYTHYKYRGESMLGEVGQLLPNGHSLILNCLTTSQSPDSRLPSPMRGHGL